MDHHFPYTKKIKKQKRKTIVRNSQNRRRGCLTHVLALLTAGLY
jgi:hypothetical protein